MNVLELKNDLHRMVVETEDVDMLAEVLQFFDKLQSVKTKKTKQPKQEITPERPPNISPSIQFKDGGWVYTGILKQSENYTDLLTADRDDRADFLMQNLIKK